MPAGKGFSATAEIAIGQRLCKSGAAGSDRRENRLASVSMQIKALMWVAYFSAIFAIWLWMFRMAESAGLGALCLLPGDVSAITRVGAVFPMWAGMAAAMMLPTLVPALRAYSDIAQRAGAAAGADNLGWFAFVAGYLCLWLVSSVGFAAAQVALAGPGLLDELGSAGIGILSATLLAVAGFWQFTRTKHACQTACLSPAMFFIGNWRAGPVGAYSMGVRFGLFCVGCCWALMALAFVGGIMNLLFMGLATALMIIEKLPDVGRYVTRPTGALLIGTSGLMLAAPLLQ